MKECKFFYMFSWLWLFCLLFGGVPSFAQEAGVEIVGTVDPGAAYVINTLVLLLCAALIMWMAAGFCMLETGMVSPRSTAIICLKNLLLYSVACLGFYFMGFHLMFTNVGSWIGSFSLLANMPSDEFAVLGSAEGVGSFLSGKGDSLYSSMAYIFFQTTFVATAASVISGALAERAKLWSFFIFVLVLSTVIYPIQGAWSWGGGWLAQMGFADFAGSTVVHSVGGWAALTGAYFLGPRQGKYTKSGEVKTFFPSSVPLVSLGVFILWMGWLGFNGGSLVVTAGVPDISKMSLILMNTNIAAASGAVAALVFGRLFYGRLNILLALNGALAGLVSITAGPEFTQPFWAVVIGVIGSIVALLTYPLLDKMRIDDVVGAVPVHLVAGVWGTLAVGIWNPDVSIGIQLLGICVVGAFVVAASSLVWWLLKITMGIRISADVEDLGQDLLELGLESDPSILKIDSMIT